jgi:hypothetical protein
MDNEAHEFAYNVLFSGAPNKINAPTRDYIFNTILDSFMEKPVKVFQVGCIETFDVRWRVGSGWSDLIFGEYIKEHGGSLTLCDISLDNVAKSFFAAKSLGYEANFVIGDAIRHIGNDDYDIYYLDGGNDPKETFDQYMAIKDKKAVIIVDDFNIKGTLLSHLPFRREPVANHVGVLDQR